MTDEVKPANPTSPVAAVAAPPHPAPAAPPKPAAAPLTPVEIADQWWKDKIHGSIIGHDTGIWNYLSASFDDLKKKLAAK